VPKNLLFLTDRLPQPNYEIFPKNKNYSFQNNSLPEVKHSSIVKNRLKDKESRGGKVNKENSNSNNKEKLLNINVHVEVDKELSTKARNSHSQQPINEIEILKKRLRPHEQPENQSDEISYHNIRVIKNIDLDAPNRNLNNSMIESRSRDDRQKINLLPKINSSQDLDNEFKENYIKKK
jgi:hypothetical protein